MAAAVGLDGAVAGAQRAGIDAEDDHAAEGAPWRAASRGGRFLHLLVRDVEVGPDVLHVVVVLEGLHELQHLLGLGALERDGVLRVLADLGLVGLDARLLDRREHRFVGRSGVV